MAWIEVYGGQRTLAFELTMAIFWVEIHFKNVHLMLWQLWTIMSVVILCHQNGPVIRENAKILKGKN